MNRIIIVDLDVPPTELSDAECVRGGGSLNKVEWGISWDFAWSHDSIAGFGTGFAQLYAFAIGAIVSKVNSFSL